MSKHSDDDNQNDCHGAEILKRLYPVDTNIDDTVLYMPQSLANDGYDAEHKPGGIAFMSH